MTTARFNRLAGPQALALNAIKSVYCKPPTFKPAAPVAGTNPCTRKGCAGTIKFTVRASGGTSGRCSTAGCLDWRE